MADTKLAAIRATGVAARSSTVYPPEFAPVVSGRAKRALGDQFGLTQYGVNLTVLAPGASSALRHWHEVEDEFIYVLEGELVLVNDSGIHALSTGMCAGFTPGKGAHQLVNQSEEIVAYLEIGDRIPGDEGLFPRDDIVAVLGTDGKWVWTHKDGKPY